MMRTLAPREKAWQAHLTSNTPLTVQKRESNMAAKAILDVAKLVNQAVGDAISCLLFVEVALRRKQWSLQQWASLYTDLPSCMLKVETNILPCLDEPPNKAMHHCQGNYSILPAKLAAVTQRLTRLLNRPFCKNS